MNISELNILIKSGDAKRSITRKDCYITKDGRVIRSDGVEVTKALNKKGFYRVAGKHTETDKQTTFAVQLLVAEAFLEPYKYAIPGKETKFKDGDASNLSYTNIEWIDDIDKSKMRVAIEFLDKDGNEVKLIEADFVTEEQKEIWLKDKVLVPMSNTPEHFIHENGFIISPNNRIRATFLNDDGYVRVAKLPSLRHSEGFRIKRVNFTMHLLVAEYFLEPYVYSNGDLTINHIDGNKLNNSKSNLAWTTLKRNINEAHNLEQVEYDAKVILTDLKENDEITMRSIREVSRYLNIKSHILNRYIPISQKYPIFKRFKLRLDKPKEFFARVKYGSKTVYVYDHVEGKLVILNSISKVSIMFGIPTKHLTSNLTDKDYIYVAGCSISYSNKVDIQKVSKETAKADRDKLWSESILTPKPKVASNS